MARYFFHVMDGKADIDSEGVECSGIDAVRQLAIRTAGEILSTGVHSWSGEAWQMFVADADGTIVFSLRFIIDRHSH